MIDFGGQYNQLIARRVRECGVYAEVHPYTIPIEEIEKIGPKGLIFTGGPNSVYGESALEYDPRLLELGIPTLGICYGAQLMAYGLGGDINKSIFSFISSLSPVLITKSFLMLFIIFNSSEGIACFKI